MSLDNITAVILAGGKGQRLASNQAVPKPLVLIDNLPMIWELISMLSLQGFKQILICLGFGSMAIRNYFVENCEEEFYDDALQVFRHPNFDVKILLLETGFNSASGFRLHQAIEYIKNDDFFLTYSDGFTDANFQDLYVFHQKNNFNLSVLGVKPQIQYGVIEADQNGKIVSFTEKPIAPYFISSGFFFIKKKFIQKFLNSQQDLDFEAIILPQIVNSGSAGLYRYVGMWSAIDTQKDLEIFKRSPLWEKLRSSFRAITNQPILKNCIQE